MQLERSCGLLLHITSLPGAYGIGTLGDEAYRFCDMLRRGGQRCWQMLPFGPVLPHLGYSPYASTSTFAGNDLLISAERIAESGWCDVPLDDMPRSDGDFVDFDQVCLHKRAFLAAAEQAFFSGAPDAELREYERFVAQESGWLVDYVLFTALAEHFGTNSWLSWPRPISARAPRSVSAWQRKLAHRIRYHSFIQYVFFKQWRALKRYCNEHDVLLIGDIPIYVTLDSADAWAHPDIFELDPDTRAPLRVSGVPPDYFSETGQRWGNPLYRWRGADGSLYPATIEWWTARVRHVAGLVDVLRIDHFRAFESCWSIPAEEPTAVAGSWIEGPGCEFFERLRAALGDLPLIAEDLGDITPAVEALRRKLALPGMKVLQFAFDRDSRNSYLPHAYDEPNCIVYTGTHDNNTTNGWFYGPELDDGARAYVMDYIGTGQYSDFHWSMIRLAYRSVARLAVIPVQDVLGYGGAFRMNLPGTAAGNWAWKLRKNAFDDGLMHRLLHLAHMYDRVPGEHAAAPKSSTPINDDF